jgi:hypothetical protein
LAAVINIGLGLMFIGIRIASPDMRVFLFIGPFLLLIGLRVAVWAIRSGQAAARDQVLRQTGTRGSAQIRLGWAPVAGGEPRADRGPQRGRPRTGEGSQLQRHGLVEGERELGARDCEVIEHGGRLLEGEVGRRHLAGGRRIEAPGPAQSIINI